MAPGRPSNLRLQAERDAREWSRADAAENLQQLMLEAGESQVGATANSFYRWEKNLRRPSRLYRRYLRKLYRRSNTELGFEPDHDERGTQEADPLAPVYAAGPGSSLVAASDKRADGTDEAQQSIPREEDTKRRQVIRAAAVMTAATIVAAAVEESREISQSVEASDLGPVTLESLNLAVEGYGLDYLAIPALKLHQQVQSERKLVVTLLRGKHTLCERRHLYTVAGWLSGLLGHLANDLGDQRAARQHCLTAWLLAKETNDRDLAAWLWGTRALIATYAGLPSEAVRCAQAGHPFAREGSTAAVRLAAQEARAYARMGDHRGTDDAMRRAERACERLSEQATCSIFSFDSPYLPFYAGTCYVWLSRPERARECAAQAIALCDTAPASWPVTRALARIDLAMSLVQQGHPDRAAEVGTEALGIYESERRVNMIVQRADELSTTMASYRSLSIVREFNERLRSISARPLKDLPAPYAESRQPAGPSS